MYLEDKATGEQVTLDEQRRQQLLADLKAARARLEGHWRTKMLYHGGSMCSLGAVGIVTGELEISGKSCWWASNSYALTHRRDGRAWAAIKALLAAVGQRDDRLADERVVAHNDGLVREEDALAWFDDAIALVEAQG